MGNSIMRKIKREDLPKVYKEIVEDEPSFDEEYKAHGAATECNWGGLVITLNNAGDACIVVRDWGGDDLHISDIREIEYFENKEAEGEDERFRPGFFEKDEDVGNEEPELLENFMRI